MSNIFANAQFGQMFITRDGRKAVYLWAINRLYHSLIVEGNQNKKPSHYDNDGNFYGTTIDTKDDIVSEWKEIGEEELDKLATLEVNKMKIFDNSITATDIYKAGYRKAKEGGNNEN